MKNIDYIIVGDGYAGYFFAHQLILHQKSFIIFSGSKNGASKISAGVINPLVLKRFTTFWLAEEQINVLHKTLSEIEKYTGKNYLIDEPIQRIFHDEKEKELWMNKSKTEELESFLDPSFKTLEAIKNPFGTGSVKKSARLNVNGFFGDLSDYLKKNNHLLQEDFEYHKISGRSYQDFNFTNIVFCEGMNVVNNPYFSNVPLIPNKGHHLKVKLSEKLNNQSTIKKKHFLFPLNEDLYYYGGTYDPTEQSDKIDDFKTQELIEGLQEFYPHKFEVTEVNCAFRPTVKDRRPIIGKHPIHQNFYIFNGLGARGILNGCYFSRELFEYIENGKELMKDVNLTRFI